MATKSTKATVIAYTDNEKAAIEVLTANKGEHLSAKKLGVSSVILESLIRKSADERPMAEGVERAMVHKEKEVGVCEACGQKFERTLYWID